MGFKQFYIKEIFKTHVIVRVFIMVIFMFLLKEIEMILWRDHYIEIEGRICKDDDDDGDDGDDDEYHHEENEYNHDENEYHHDGDTDYM